MKKRLLLHFMLLSMLLSGSTKLTTSSQEKYLTTWLEDANLDGIETPEELYQQALSEDILIVYSTTTRIYDVKESFEANYPGVFVEVYDTRATDLVESLKAAYEQEDWGCDIVISSDDTGTMTEELVPLHIVNKYVPPTISPFIKEDSNGVLLEFIKESTQLFYNYKAYPTCPIENWWELTQPEWNGKVYMNSPLRSYPAYGLFFSIVTHDDEMAQAYEDLYGTALTIPDDSSAGKIFFEMLVANGMHFTTSSNELVELVGHDSSENSPLVFMISSKIRRHDIGFPIAVAYGVAPCDGVYSTNTISIAGGSKNVAAAKLFIYHLLGESDGTGEGLSPYLLEGTWSVRTDVETASERSLDQVDFWVNEKENLAAKREEFTAYWTNLQENAERN